MLLCACGGHSSGNRASAGGPEIGGTGGSAGAPVTSGAGAGGSAGRADLDDAPPPAVDPEVSRAWTWQPCGTLTPEGADREALFDGSGHIIVLGPSDVRVYDATGTLDESASGAAADFLVVDPDGAVVERSESSSRGSSGRGDRSAPSTFCSRPQAIVRWWTVHS